MNLTCFFILLAVLQIVCLGIGYRASRKQKSQSDYYLAGRSLSFFPLLMTFVATQVGGGLILGSAEEAYRMGWKIIFYPLGAISGFFLLGSGLGRRLSMMPVSTVAQIFEVYYGSKRLKQIASVFSVVTLFLITIAQVIASQKFLGSFQLDGNLWFFLFWGVILLYTMWGGMEGIASIDLVQASYFLIAFGIGVAWVLSNNPDLNVLSVVQTSYSKTTGDGSPSWVGWFLMPCLFMLIEQDMAQRCFSSKSPAIMQRAATASAVIIFVVSLIPIYFGMAGQARGIIVPPGSSALMVIIDQISSPVITAVIACAIMMAIISTAVSLIHSVSSNISQDFQLKFKSERSQLFFSKGVTLSVGVLAVVGSLFFENIVNLLMLSYELSVVCLFVPVLMALILKSREQKSFLSAALAMAFGGGSLMYFKLVGSPGDLVLPREVMELFIALLGFGIGELVSSKRRASSLLSPIRLASFKQRY